MGICRSRKLNRIFPSSVGATAAAKKMQTAGSKIFKTNRLIFINLTLRGCWKKPQFITIQSNTLGNYWLFSKTI